MMGKMKFLCCLILLVNYTTAQNLELKHRHSAYKSETQNVVKGLKDLTKRKDVIIIEVDPNKAQNSEYHDAKSDDNSIEYEDDVGSVDSKDTDPELPNLGLRAINYDGNRSYGFSADYIDMAELARAEAELMEKGKQLVELKKKLKQTPTSSKLTEYLLSKLFNEADDDQERWYTDDNNDKLTPYLGRRSHKRKPSSESVSAEKSKEKEKEKEEEEEEEESVEVKKKRNKKKTKVVSTSGESASSLGDEVTTRRPRPKRKKKSKVDEKYDIIQSPFRKIKARKSSESSQRRSSDRLPHFLPKRK